MDNNIDTNWYYVSYCLKGVRTFAKLRPIRIPAELGRRYLKGDNVTEELQERIRNSTSREITDLNDIIILSVTKRLQKLEVNRIVDISKQLEQLVKAKIGSYKDLKNVLDDY